MQPDELNFSQHRAHFSGNISDLSGRQDAVHSKSASRKEIKQHESVSSQAQ